MSGLLIMMNMVATVTRVETGVTGATMPGIRSETVVDVHAHALPMGLLTLLESRGQADLSAVADGALYLDPVVSGIARGARIPLPIEQYSLEHRLEAMTRAGIDRQLISAPPFVFGSMSDDPAFALDLARRSNDALAEFVAGEPRRLCALGTVPVGAPGAVDEAVRCVDELGMSGLTIGTFGAGRELDDPANDELWALLTQRRIFCFVHPSRASSPPRVRDFHLVQLLGYPAETALAASRLIFGGVLDRHDPVLCLAHGGGCLVGLAPRLDLGWNRKREAHTSARTPSEYLRRLSYDSALYDNLTLSRLIHDVGAENVLLGTDMPFDLADTDAVPRIRQGFPAEIADAVLGGNARRLAPATTDRRPVPAAPDVLPPPTDRTADG